MRTVYWLIGLFALWCVASGAWYIVGVKHLSTDPSAFSAVNNISGIVEISLMLLVSFLIGFVVAYKLRGNYIRKVWDSLNQLIHQLDFKEDDLRSVRLQIVSLEKEKAVLMERSMAIGTHSSRELGWLQQQLEQARAREKELAHEVASLTARAEQLEGQISHLQLKLIETEKDARTKATKFIRPDDLTRIKGIGPFIERRLNKMGIYTYQQISEMDAQSIEKVGETIKFFPDRILRDDWIGQARRLQ